MSTHEDLGEDGVIVLGAGLAGCLMACYLQKRGYKVLILESRPDMRKNFTLAGRSINLIMTSRGFNSLAGVGLAEEVEKITVPVYGRTLHSKDSQLAFQRYGPDDTYCNFSVSRAQLNVTLLNAAERFGARIIFEYPLDFIDVEKRICYSYVRKGISSHLCSFKAKHVFATDGAGSRARQTLIHLKGAQGSDQTLPLGAGYKELLMPADANGGYKIDKDSLHIWPRGSHFLMALPNLSGSFTMTLYMPEEGPLSFKSLDSPEKIKAYFQEYYPDAVPLMPGIIEDFKNNPTGFLGTVKCSSWHHQDCLVLLGDAAHAITPFFGQGCNAAFEGVAVLDKLLGKHGRQNVAQAFAEYEKIHKPSGDAIGTMAVDNYFEMMDKTGDAKFLLAKQVEIIIAKQFPIYCSRYAMVTHTLIPYKICMEVGLVQQEILTELCCNITKEDEVDMKKAGSLIDKKLLPLLQKYGITEEDYKDSAWKVKAKL